MAKAGIDKKRTTIYLSSDVLEFLTIRRAKGAGSVSRQLEDLARTQMPRRATREDIEALEAKDALGYRRHPQTSEEVDDWQAEQVWE